MERRIRGGYEYIVYTDNGRKRRRLYHRWLWEQVRGPIPQGAVIHHIDGDRLHNMIDNLTCLPLSQHTANHIADRYYRTGENGERERLCPACSRYLPIPAFRGRGHCIECTNARRRARYHADPERSRAAAYAWRAKHYEEVRERARARRETHRAEANAVCRLWRQQHPERVKAKNRQYYEEHHEELKAAQRERNRAYRAAAKAAKAEHQ